MKTEPDGDNDTLSGNPRQGFFKIDLPEISDVPPAIQGQDGDGWTNKVAIMIVGETPDFDQAWAWLKEWNKTCKPEWQEYRLKQKLESAWNYRYAHWGELRLAPIDDDRPRARKRRVSFKRLNEIALTAKGKYDELLAAITDKEIPPLETVIDELYPGNPLLCRAAGSQNRSYTDDRESIRGVEKEFEWIVPSPMSARTGFAHSTGNPRSYRCRENAGEWRYMVIEFDFGYDFKEHIERWAAEGISSRDVQARLIEWLATEGEPKRWPFMIVDSGGKSLHNWYVVCPDFPEESGLALLERAIPLSADHRGGLPENLFRFPGGTRKSQKSQPQPILYYDGKQVI